MSEKPGKKSSSLPDSGLPGRVGEKEIPERSVRMSIFAQLGAFGSALIASACCWLPLLLIAFGVSGGALSARFEALRPVTLPVTFLLLGIAFYFTYRSPKSGSSADGASEAGECCTAPPAGGGTSRLKRINKITLWIATAMTLAFAFFPNYSGLLFKTPSRVAITQSAEIVRWEMEIRGMTCASCAVALEKGLKEVPGVEDAKVSYDERKAVVFAEPTISADELKRAVRKLGYTAVHVKKKEGGTR